jgi:hypothetical protein
LAQGYPALLTLLAVVLPAPASRRVSAHGTFITAAILGSYLYQDIWPLLSLYPSAYERGERALWAKVALATARSIILPMFEPFPYIPVDPEVAFPFLLDLLVLLT